MNPHIIRRMNLTPWFPPEVKPVHVGVYETQVAGGAWYDFWDGKNWWVGHLTPEKAMMSHQYEPQLYIPLPPITWRGLAEKP